MNDLVNVWLSGLLTDWPDSLTNSLSNKSLFISTSPSSLLEGLFDHS